MEYDEKCPFPYNNFTYQITLAAPAKPRSFVDAGACTSLPPEEGVTSVVIGLSNPLADGLNQTNRVQNEVASIYFARQGAGAASTVFPSVYDWQRTTPHPDGHCALGWILMELKTGVALDQHFARCRRTRSTPSSTRLPKHSPTFSALRYPKPSMPTADKSQTMGVLRAEQMTTLKGGPWPTYAAFLRAKFVSRLGDADGSLALRGWRDNGVRERIDAFLAPGLDRCLAGAIESASVNVNQTQSDVHLFEVFARDTIPTTPSSIVQWRSLDSALSASKSGVRA